MVLLDPYCYFPTLKRRQGGELFNFLKSSKFMSLIVDLQSEGTCPSISEVVDKTSSNCTCDLLRLTILYLVEKNYMHEPEVRKEQIGLYTTLDTGFMERN